MGISMTTNVAFTSASNQSDHAGYSQNTSGDSGGLGGGSVSSSSEAGNPTVKKTSVNITFRQAQQTADALSKHTSTYGFKVVVDHSASVNHMWLNIVDSSTGQVVEKLPPEGIRKFIETLETRGLTVDKKY